MIARRILPIAFGLFALLWVGACGRSTTGLEEAPANTDPVVFDDDFGSAVDFQAFLGSKTTAVSIDDNVKYDGTASLKVTVPSTSDDDGNWAGGAFTTRIARDFTGYNALTLWARASEPLTLDVAGLANDNTGTSLYEASWSGIPVTTEWREIVIPIPLPAKLNREKGLFFFAEGAENDTGYDLWFDEVRFDSVAGISDPRPSITSKTVSAFVGAPVSVGNGRTTFRVGETDEPVDHLPGYFTFASSNEAVATVSGNDIIPVGAGTATITAKLGSVDATGSITLEVTAPPAEPAPTPTVAQGDVISLFSDVYADVTVDTWSATWDQADVSDFDIGGDAVKSYTNFVFAGVEFTSEVIDAREMTHLHVDVWVPEGSVFRIKLVDFGEDGTFGGAPDSEHEIAFNASTTPALVTGSWVSFDIPFSDFTRLTAREHLAQLIFSGDTPTVYVDNVYLHR